MTTSTELFGDEQEKPRMWQKMIRAWPDYDADQERTDRVIPIVVIERA